MESTAIERQRLRSLEILFGADLNASGEFLEYLQMSGLKSAYRKRAMETHPDRIAAKECLAGQADNKSFYAVREAYEDLLDYLKKRELARLRDHMRKTRQGSADWRKPASAPFFQGRKDQRERCTDAQQPFLRQAFRPIILPSVPKKEISQVKTEDLYRGSIPNRPLLFGHFLYYCGLTNWRTVSRVLIWQRQQRPRLGELGLRSGMLSQEDIELIVHNKIPMQLFGQTARRLRLTTEYHVQTLLALQRRLQKKFGTILVEKNLIDHSELQELIRRFECHNENMCLRWKDLRPGRER